LDTITFVLFGASGDLAKRKIFPALYHLNLDQKLPKPISIIGLAIEDWTDHDFQEKVKESINTFAQPHENNEKELEEFLNAFRYSRLDAKQPDDFKKLLELVKQREAELKLEGNRLFYLSVAPDFFEIIALNIKESGLADTKGWKRLMIEKPFGHDLNSARELNQTLSKAFEEEEIYRIDHFLGKPMIQNLEALEFANPILQSTWNNGYVANVQITASETVGVEKRAGYYDHTGAIRDMIQNHMLQMVMLTAMRIPKCVTGPEIRGEKRKVIEAVRPLKKEEVKNEIIRGQYISGELDGKPVVAYKEEPGVDPSSNTDTFVAARLWIDNDSWKGVPFYIRTGKRLKEKLTRIVIEYKNPLEKHFEAEQKEDLAPNLLIIDVSPGEEVSLQLNSKNPLKDGKIEPVRIHYSTKDKSVPEAYEWLIYDAIIGDTTFFAHWRVVESSWKWVQPLLDAFAENLLPLHEYKSGTWGPEAVDALLKENGFQWWMDETPS
jgi:glucose-6-phosphate 1-dehydrogenase